MAPSKKKPTPKRPAASRKPEPSPRRGPGFGSFLLLLIVLAAGVGAWLTLAPFGPRSETFVDIPTGANTEGIARALERGGVLRSRFSLLAARVLTQLVDPRSLKAGEYRFDHPVSAFEVLDRLRRGDVYTVELVIPEGFNLFDIAAAVEKAKLATAADFLASARANTGLIRTWSPDAASLEGFLFPDTYRFSRHATPLSIEAAMVKRFGQIAGRLDMGDAPRSVAETVAMASLVEREVHLDRERPVVAGVFENRLRLGMPLQTDPAVVYASQLRGTWTGVIHQSELHSDSPYNTYTHAGLPPGPICNPGVAALHAALHPAKTDFLYFVANADGSTRFARELKEHLANVAVYRSGERDGKGTDRRTDKRTAAHKGRR